MQIFYSVEIEVISLNSKLTSSLPSIARNLQIALSEIFVCFVLWHFPLFLKSVREKTHTQTHTKKACTRAFTRTHTHTIMYTCTHTKACAHTHLEKKLTASKSRSNVYLLQSSLRAGLA